MADLTSSKFKKAWIDMIAKAAFCHGYEKSLKENPVIAFKEYEVDVDNGINLNEDISPSLEEALNIIRQAHTQYSETIPDRVPYHPHYNIGQFFSPEGTIRNMAFWCACSGTSA